MTDSCSGSFRHLDGELTDRNASYIHCVSHRVYVASNRHPHIAYEPWFLRGCCPLSLGVGAQAWAMRSEWLQPQWQTNQQPLSTQWSKSQSWMQCTGTKWYREQICGQWWWSADPSCHVRRLQTAGNCAIKVPQVELDGYTFIHKYKHEVTKHHN